MAQSLNAILRFAVGNEVSDIHLKVGRPPILRKHGRLMPLKGADILQPIHIKNWLSEMATDTELKTFQESGDLEFAFVVDEVGRFRVTAYQQRQLPSIAIRVVPSSIRTISELELPAILGELCLQTRGLILLTGATGSGKSTTLSAMVNHINISRPVHILTIEDPLEVIHDDVKGLINQREVGRDTKSYEKAILAALRQDPDVLMIGEMRDLDTIRSALVAAETGHLVLSTLHTIDAVETISRIITSFPPHEQHEIRNLLGNVLVAIISQRMVPRTDNSGMVVACEIMIATEYVRECIHHAGRTPELYDYMGRSQDTHGSQTFDQALVAHYRAGLITMQCALDHASVPGDMQIKLSGIGD